MKYFNSVILTSLLLAAAAAAFYGPPPPYAPPPLELYYGNLFEAKKGAPLPTLAQHNYDVRKYTIQLDIDDENTTVDAVTTVRLESKESSLTRFSLDFTTALKVTRVTRGSTPLNFDHQNNLLTITLDRPMGSGELFDVAIEYNGKPGYGFFFTAGGVFTSTEESFSRNWFPCYDDPSDKADACELLITVRDDWYVASNGLLVTTAAAGTDKIQYRWVHNYPIATYLVAIACADYYTNFNQRWKGMPVNYYIYDNQVSAAPIFFENQLDMLDCFSGLFGEYPFRDEKYGVAAVNMTNFGGMENQTCTYIRSSYIGPNHNGDHLLAHELAHSWWGDRVTCGTWKDLWLNEGQATYSDALHTEDTYGDAAFRSRMASYAESYFREDEESRFPIYDPQYPWSSTVYQKGAWVLHMLRRLMGDQDFYTAWNSYGAKHEYSTAITDDLQDEFEAEYGADLDWFFQQWVYKAGYPVFKYSWTTSNGGKTVKVTIDQVQKETPVTPIFRCLVDLTFSSAGDTDYVKSVWVDKRKHSFEFTFPEPIYWVYFDKDVWLLHKSTMNIGISLDYLRARANEKGVVVSWATSTERDFAGFNLYRESAEGAATDGKRVQLNDELITGRSPYRFVDRGARAGHSYKYWLEAVDLNGARESFGPAKIELGLKPAAFALHQNSPNPARGATTFAFSLPAAGPASLAVYDMAGRQVWRHDGTFAGGENELQATFELAPGVYVYRLDAAGEHAAKRMVIVR